MRLAVQSSGLAAQLPVDVPAMAGYHHGSVGQPRTPGMITKMMITTLLDTPGNPTSIW